MEEEEEMEEGAEQEVLDADISVEDAMKMIFSGGIVLPTKRSHQEPPPRVG